MFRPRRAPFTVWILTVMLICCLHVPAGAESTAVGSTPEQPVSIWHIPHPDDETLGMAGAIMASAASGRRNIVVFYTQGGASGVLWVLNGAMHSRVHGRYLHPEADGYVPLTTTDFKQARVREAKAALALLGVHPDDIHVLDFPDGDLRVSDALPIMRSFAQQYPHALHGTTALTDPHPDHQALARALITLAKERHEQNLTTETKFLAVYRYGSDQNTRHENLIAVPVPDLLSKQQALAQFTHWDPAAGRFAIGLHSVPLLFAGAHDDPFEYEQPLNMNVPWTQLGDRRRGVVLFIDNVAVDYPIARHWSLRLATPYTLAHVEPSVLRKTPRIGNLVSAFVGIGYRTGTLPSTHLVLGMEWLQTVVIEYRHGPGGDMHVGLRIAF